MNFSQLERYTERRSHSIEKITCTTTELKYIFQTAYGDIALCSSLKLIRKLVDDTRPRPPAPRIEPQRLIDVVNATGHHLDIDQNPNTLLKYELSKNNKCKLATTTIYHLATILDIRFLINSSSSMEPPQYIWSPYIPLQATSLPQRITSNTTLEEEFFHRSP